MGWIDALKSHLLELPDLVKFAIIIAAFVGIPPLANRVRLPASVGLLFFGAILGPHALGVFGENRPTVDFFSEIGKLLLMFSAGLEIDLALFHKAQTRSITFGVITTTVPLLLGTLLAFGLGNAAVPAIVIGSLLASHTLISLPIIQRIGAMQFEPVVVAIGTTLVSDTLSLIVFAICVSVYTTGFSVSALGQQLVEITVFVPLILIGLARGGAYVLSKVERREEAYFGLMLGIMAVAGVIADQINLPGIVGAFLAGLAVNGAAREHPAKEKLEFFGKSLFIPSFFVATGMLINPTVFVSSLVHNLTLVIGLITALVAGKGIAAVMAGRLFAYPRASQLTMWALTLPQVAATLAATLVAVDTKNGAGQRLLDETTLNAVLVLVVVTAMLGPTLTELLAPRMADTLGSKTSAGSSARHQPA